MNAFANSIFSILFAWLRTLVESLWHSAASGSFSGLLTWLGGHWVIVAVALCVICTVLDYLVWLIRWRPYVIWRQKIARLLGHSPQRAEEESNFEQGYVGGVEIDLPQMPLMAEPWEEPFYPEPAQTESPLYAASAPDVSVSPAPQVYEAAPAFAAAPQIYPAETPQTHQAPAMPEMPAAESPVYFPVEAAASPAPRRRRSTRHEKRASSLPGKLLAADDEEDSLLDGLPPAVDRSSAFHRPVYPDQSAQAFWNDKQDGGKNG